MINIEKYFVYAIKSQVDSRIYVGFSRDVLKRLEEHNSGTTKSTKGYLPWELVYCEIIIGRASAREKEKFLKSGYGKEILKKLLRDAPNESLDCNKTFEISNHNPIVLRVS